MHASELFARLTDDVPAAEPVVPVAFLADQVLPERLWPVEPVAFVLAIVRATWGAAVND